MSIAFELPDSARPISEDGLSKVTGDGLFVRVEDLQPDDAAGPVSVGLVAAEILGRYKAGSGGSVQALVSAEVPGAAAANVGAGGFTTSTGEVYEMIVVVAGGADGGASAVQLAWPATSRELLLQQVGAILDSICVGE